MMDFEQAGYALDELIDELPEGIFKDLNGGVNLIEDEKKSEDGRYTLGTYFVNGMGRYIEIYYGSFIGLYGETDDELFKKRLKKTLHHELTHHVENMAGDRSLERWDERQSQLCGFGDIEVHSILFIDLRRRAKAVNFGIVYGISSWSLSQDIGVMPYEAKEYMDAYLSNYSGVRSYMDDIVKKAKSDGYVSTEYNRRRELPELHSSNFNTRSFGERVALNMPIQGTAADIIKLAMVRVYKRLNEEKLESRLILQVHDELICECPENEAAKVAEILREEMENAAKLSVPLTVDAASGHSWAEAH